MRSIKLVADSTANLTALPGVDFAFAPLKVIAGETEFVDDTTLDIPVMVDYMEHYKGRSKTSCPNAADWLSSFGEADDIICITITGALSGSYNAALSAGRIYEAERPGARVFVLDSKTAGPELLLLVEHAGELIRRGESFERITAALPAYLAGTELIFMLKSLHNFAANGRVSPAVARITGLLGICIVGRASDEGTLEPTDKCRGEARSLDRLLDHMAEAGLKEGRVSLAHCQNQAGAEALQARIIERFPAARVDLRACRGLCSYYVEAGGILVGFEKR